jgi:plasmid stabilization system protein ParE
VARQLGWSPEANQDVDSIRAYLERNSPGYAKAVVARIIATTESIAVFPESGRLVPGVHDPHVRERFVHRYRIVYRLEPERVYLVAIIHGSRLMTALLERLELSPEFDD